VVLIWPFFFCFYPGASAFGGHDPGIGLFMPGIPLTYYFSIGLIANQLEDEFSLVQSKSNRYLKFTD
jgi:hypothetical protein